MKNETDTTYSPRSQRSLLEEDRLRDELIRIDNLIRYTQRNISKLDHDRASTLKAAASGGHHSQPFLARTLEELEGARRTLTAYNEKRASIEARIAELAPSPATVAERAERQNHLARLAAERLKKDELADGALKGLRRLLEERRELTAKILKAAEAAEFTAGDDGLDARRLDELLTALPEGLLGESTRWAGWFLGNEEAKTYVVRDRVLVEPETLASHGVNYFGERIELSDEQARELLREDRPARTNVAPWRCAPPSIMTLEAWDAAIASAKERGSTIEEVLFWEDYERDAKIRERFNPMSAVETGRYEDHGDPVKVRSQSGIKSNGGRHEPGELMEITEGRWNLCERIHIGSFARP